MTALNLQNFTGVATGTPTKGRIGLWYKATDYTKITNVKIRIGSDSSNYLSVTITPTSNSWVFYDASLITATIV